MSHYLFLVETKKEYTIHLVNALAPLMYEGILSIYEDAKNHASENEELILFQSLLRKIPSWNDHLIVQETNRIIKLSAKGNIIEDLIKAVIKSNIMVLTNTPPDKKDNMRIKHDITTNKFIHNSYIEIARNIFQNPYLFYHKYDNIELKRNQREATEIIKKSIEQSIRKLLPMNIILQNYLGNTFENQSDDFQNPIPESEYIKLRSMLNKDPTNNDAYQLVKKKTSPTINTSSKPKSNKSEHIPISKSPKMSEKPNDEPPNNVNDDAQTTEINIRKTEVDKVNNKQNDEDDSVSYFRQMSEDNKIVEIYDNDKKEKQLGGAMEPLHKHTTKIEKESPKLKAFINYDNMSNNNSSVDLKLIMNDISSIDHVKNKPNENNMKKYFNKTSNL